MHNLHLLVVKASSAKEACDIVETEIQDFGNENNWRHICGAVSEDNEVFINDKDGRYPPDEESNTIEKINKMVIDWMADSSFVATAKKKIEAGEINFSKWDRQELYSLKKYAEYLYQIEGKTPNTFNILDDNCDYFDYQYNECGVTQLAHIEHEDGDKIYVVFIDMHD